MKNKSIKNKSLIKKEILKKVPKISEARFDVWRPITKTFAQALELNYFTAGNNDWGGNRFNIDKYFYLKFFKNFGDKALEERYKKKFEVYLYDLLKLSVEKTPQKSTKERKFPFKQQTKYSQTYASLGNETYYSDNHNSSNHYYYRYCNKTKIKFFKGPSDQEKKIVENNWQNIFSESFIYGYILILKIKYY